MIKILNISENYGLRENIFMHPFKKQLFKKAV